MIVFWIAAALLSAAAAALVVHFASREPLAVRVDPAAAVYRRQLDEIDDLADRGLLGEDERRSAHAEAGRRLLAVDAAPLEAPATAKARWSVMVAVLGACVAAIAIYLFIGHAGMPDQPFKLRAAGWTAAAKAGQMNDLDAAKIAIVMQAAVKDHPGEADPLFFLARFQMESGQLQLGIHNLRKAIAITPNRADMWAALGEALTIASSDQSVTPEARAAFAKAQSLDAKLVSPRYFLARAKIAAGDIPTGLAEWKALVDGLPPGDEQRATIEADIARVEKTGSLVVQEAPQAAPSDDMIRGMVASLAAKLKDNPNDVQGWARLIRSYAVLGDKAKMNAALEEARRIFKDKPSDRAVIESAAERPQGSE